MRRFFRVWLGFLAFMLAMFAAVALLLVPGSLLVYYAEAPWWVGLLVTYLVFSLVWAWGTITPWSRRIGLWIIAIDDPARAARYKDLLKDHRA